MGKRGKMRYCPVEIEEELGNIMVTEEVDTVAGALRKMANYSAEGRTYRKIGENLGLFPARRKKQ